jgi:broad specificity phosphatase PhoE
VLILARHGQTAANASGLLLGRNDVDLNEVGRGQATAVGRALAGATRVISSPLLRARRTAEAIGLPVEIDDRWIEVDYGIYDGEPLADVPREVWEHWRHDPEWCPPEGESMASVGRRVREACDGLVEAASASDVVVVSHVSPIKAAVTWALGVGDEATWRMFLDVASISRIGVSGRGPSLRSYNDCHHLEG